MDRGPVELWELLAADAPFDAEFDEGLPYDEEWVLVLGDGPESGHVRFADIVGGERFVFLGRVYASRLTSAGELQVRSTGEVLSTVTATFVRHAPVLLDLTLRLEDGSESTLSVTEGHPFYVPAEDTYRPVSELEVGTALRVVGGGEAVLVAVERRTGDFEVFNFEVSGQHNYFAGESGVAVHNAQRGGSGGYGKPGCSFRGGKKKRRDRWYGTEIEPDFLEFKDWWHAEKHYRGKSDIDSRRMAWALLEEFREGCR